MQLPPFGSSWGMRSLALGLGLYYRYQGVGRSVIVVVQEEGYCSNLHGAGQPTLPPCRDSRQAQVFRCGVRRRGSIGVFTETNPRIEGATPGLGFLPHPTTPVQLFQYFFVYQQQPPKRVVSPTTDTTTQLIRTQEKEGMGDFEWKPGTVNSCGWSMRFE